MHASLIEQLATRLGISPDEAERALRSFVNHLLEQINSEGEAEVPGLGVFKRDGETLAFVPSPALEIAANYRFAGMPILPVSPEPAPPEEDTLQEKPQIEVPAEEETVAQPEGSIAKEETEEGQSADLFSAETHEETIETEEEIWTAPQDDSDHPLGPLPEPSFEEADFDLLEDEKKEGVASERLENEAFQDVSPEELPKDDTSLFNIINVPEATPTEPGLPDTTATPPQEPPESGEESVASPTPDKEPMPSPKAPRRPPAAPHRRRQASDSEPKRLIYVALGIIAILAGAFFAYQMLKPGAPEPVPPPLTTTSPSEDTTQAATLPPPDTTQAPAEAQPEVPPQRSLGGIDRSAGGWTVIVASETSREAAEEAAQPYLDLGLPVDVLRGVSGGVTRYRVGVGQFASQAEAEAAIERLRDRLPPGAWPLRITPRM